MQPRPDIATSLPSVDPTAPTTRDGRPVEIPDLEGATAEEVVAWGLDTFHPGIALASSFQQEESVLLDIVFSIRPDARVFALDTDLLFPETYAVWQAVEERYGITVERWRGPTIDEQAAEHGPELWRRDPSACCGIRKVGPLRDGLSRLDAWVTGIRREQAPTRAGARKVEWDAAFGLVKLNPLADWTHKDVWRRIAERDLPYNALHDRGYASIGCVPCTAAGSGREGRWATTDKTECGLHVEDA
ncbi:MAG: phosphoadenylyl-sulfate reductase [Solirubrobacteraceae bacterium]|nr:phosphoadenylyl-sulfate reductase [Solirubrobacteraceae bacterium]